MILNYPQTLQLAARIASTLRKNKTSRDWIFYVNPEQDVIPAGILAGRFPGALVAPASPIVLHALNSSVLQKSILFSVLADQSMFDIWGAILDLKGVSMTTVSFFKLIDDPKFWLEIALREEVKFEW
jgi:hypothetical protein